MTCISELVKLLSVYAGSVQLLSSRVRRPPKVIFNPVFYDFLLRLHILHNTPIK